MLPNVHDPEYWHEELQPLLVDIDFALRLAVPKAHTFFAEYVKKPINRPLLSNLIRYFVLDYLLGQGRDAVEFGDPDSWGLRSLSNNGIEITYRRSRIRFRKGIEPPCPTTISAQDFYQQWLSEEFTQDGVVTNLLILWNLDAQLQYSGDLRLIRPVDGNRQFAEWEWSKRVALTAVDPGRVIGPDYSLPSELPLDPSQPSQDLEDDEETEGTGTDDAD